MSPVRAYAVSSAIIGVVLSVGFAVLGVLTYNVDFVPLGFAFAAGFGAIAIAVSPEED